MGETWKARRAGLGADAPVVVVKRILPEFASDPGFVESFVNEAHVTASLDHPNIAHVLDFGQVDGEYFFVIEFVHGRTVQDLLRAAAARGLNTLPVPVACHLAIEVLAGLQYAHSRLGPEGAPLRIVHRDISPDNVLVGFDGSTRLVDFGVAKARLRGRRETQAGQVKGKWPFFSPEQARAEALDGRSDLWALGVVLYRMVCGRLPFDGDWHSTAQKILRGEFLPPLLLNPDLPTPVVDAITRALQVNREHRFQSAENMAIGLRLALASAAPDFDRAQFREFVCWAFSEALPGEGIRWRAKQTDLQQFEHWVTKARTSDSKVPAAGPEYRPPVAQPTAMTRGPAAGRRSSLGVLLLLMVAGALLAGAAFILGFEAAPRGEPPHEVEVLPRASPQTTTAPVAVPVEVPVATPPPPVAVVDAGTPRRAPSVSTVVINPNKKQRVALKFEQHNLAVLFPRPPAPDVLTFPKPTTVVVRIKSNTVFTGFTELWLPTRRVQYAAAIGDYGVNSERALSVRLFDFRPFAASASEVPGNFGAIDVFGAQTTKLPTTPITQEQGHFVILQGLEGRRRVQFAYRYRRDDVFNIVVGCDGHNHTLYEEVRIFDNPVSCALALVAAPNSRGVVEVEVTTDLSGAGERKKWLPF